TVDPSGANECTDAPTSIWGVDYILAEQGNPLLGGMHRLQRESDTDPEQFFTVDSVIGGAGPVYGVSLEYVPSCSEDTPVDNDFIPGTRTSVNNPSQSNLQLVFQTGS